MAPDLAAVVAMEHRWLAGRAPRTQKEYADELLRFVAWWKDRGGGPETILETSVADAREYASHLSTRKGAASVNRSLAALSSLWRSAGQEFEGRGLTLINPWAPGVTRRPPVRDTTADRILTEGEVQALIRAARPGRERALALLLYHTGLRVGEACGATWSDIHETPRGWTITVMGKGGKTRTTGISREALRELRSIRVPGNHYLLPGHGPDGRTGRQGAEKRIRRIAERVGIREKVNPTRPVSPHWLRHSFGTHALHRGADIATIMAALGHSDLRTTSRYVHAQPDKTGTDYILGADRRPGGFNPKGITYRVRMADARGRPPRWMAAHRRRRG